MVYKVALYMEAKNIMEHGCTNSVFYCIFQNEEFWHEKAYIEMPYFKPYEDALLGCGDGLRMDTNLYTIHWKKHNFTNSYNYNFWLEKCRNSQTREY